MADRIVVTQSGITSVVKELQEEQKNIGDYIKSIDTELGNINKAWEGADAIKYTEKMKDDYQVLLTDYNECLQSYIDFLEEVPSKYDELNNEYQGKTIEV